jgi:hypothetical protein
MLIIKNDATFPDLERTASVHFNDIGFPVKILTFVRVIEIKMREPNDR